jgi:hypothetical protein
VPLLARHAPWEPLTGSLSHGVFLFIMLHKELLEQREINFPAWRITKKRTMEKTGIEKYPYRAMIGGYWILLNKDKREVVSQHKYNFIKHYKIIPKSWQVIHHIDGDKLNNKPENLRLMTFNKHRKLHSKVYKQVAILRRKSRRGK